MSVEILVALILILLLGVLVILIWGWKAGEKSVSKDAVNGADWEFEESPSGTQCPLCGEFLPRGMRVHSVVYPGREFDLMRIYGCPNCRSDGPGNADRVLRKRYCPYCGEKLPADGYVMAQVYRKPYKKPHVHVYGCTVCKPGRG